jgi:hypothetical protein
MSMIQAVHSFVLLYLPPLWFGLGYILNEAHLASFFCASVIYFRNRYRFWPIRAKRVKPTEIRADFPPDRSTFSAFAARYNGEVILEVSPPDILAIHTGLSSMFPAFWHKLLAVLLFAACVPIAAALQADELKVGAAKRIITPDPLLPVSGGMGPTVPATKKLGEMSTRAIVIESGDTKLAIVSIDALGFPSVLISRVAKMVPGIKPENIIVGATHTHSGPDFYAFPDGKGGHTGDLKYIDQVCKWMAEAINEADSNKQLAKFRSAVGDVQGQVAYNYYAIELFDPRANVLQFLDGGNKPIATLVNYAIHPEVLGNEVGAMSPDLIGPLCDRVEQQIGGMALFMNSAQGGMVTADNRDLTKIADPLRGRWQDKREWSECIRIGEQLANESLRILGDTAVEEKPEVRCEHRMVEFPVDSDALWGVVQYSPLQYPHNKEKRTITSRINLIRLGRAYIATIPGEALPNIGMYLKRKMPGEQNMVFGLTNDAFGYILTEVDYSSFSRYSYISRVSLGERTGTILLKAILP